MIFICVKVFYLPLYLLYQNKDTLALNECFSFKEVMLIIKILKIGA